MANLRFFKSAEIPADAQKGDIWFNTEDKVIYVYVGVTQPDNEIWYTSSDGNVVTPQNVADGNKFYFNPDDENGYIPMISNTYENGKGIIKLQTGLPQLCENAFSDCTSLTGITIPDSVTSIGNYAFQNCSGLTSITLGNSVTSIGNYAFDTCSKLTGITIPDSVTSIGEFAFYGCKNLLKITIPKSVTSIGEGGINSCSMLESVIVLSEVPPTIGTYVFEDDFNAVIYVPASSVKAYKTATNWSDYASMIQPIPE